MTIIRKLVSYNNSGKSCEVFNVLYENPVFMLIQSTETKLYYFGLRSDFNSIWGFPVNDSALSLNELIERLDELIELDGDPKNAVYEQVQKQNIGCTNVDMWEAMKSAAQ